MNTTKFKDLINSLFHQKEAFYKTYMWKSLTTHIRSEIFKQNSVCSDDFKNLTYFVFQIKTSLLILADIDFETLRIKVESYETLEDWYNLNQSIPYVFIIE